MRDQIIIVLKDNNMRQEELKRSRDWETLRRKSMKMKTAAKGGAELNVEEVFKPIRINKVKQMICIELKKKKVLCATTVKISSMGK